MTLIKNDIYIEFVYDYLMSSSNLRDTYNRIAKDFADEHYEDTWDDDYIAYFITALAKGAKVLDLGCGAGNDSAKLAASGLSVEGIDLSDKLIEIAKKKNPSLKFIQGDILNLPYDDNSFDGIFAKASLLHIAKKDMPKALNEIKRVLRAEGVLHITIKEGEGEEEVVKNDYGYDYTRFFSYWKMEPFIELLEKYSFKVIRKELFRSRPTSYTIWIKILATR